MSQSGNPNSTPVTPGDAIGQTMREDMAALGGAVESAVDTAEKAVESAKKAAELATKAVESVESAVEKTAEKAVGVPARKAVKMASSAIHQTNELASVALERTQELKTIALERTHDLKSKAVERTHVLAATAVERTQELKAVERTLWARFYDWIELKFVGLTTRSHLFHRMFSFVWLPVAFKSGIKFVRADDGEITGAIVPFSRFNRNWYKAMAGASMLANAELAGGMYVFEKCAGHTVVCKNLEYKFLRPCLGKAMFRIEPQEDIEALMAEKTAFNMTVDLNVVQMKSRKNKKERRVGRVTVTYHVKPKQEVRDRENRKR